MRATGIVRRIDDLGRIVIPKEIRKTMHIRESDPLEIFTEHDGSIILKKYSPIGEMGQIAKQYAESIAATLPHTICICDQDSVIAAAGPNGKNCPENSCMSRQNRSSLTADSSAQPREIRILFRSSPIFLMNLQIRLWLRLLPKEMLSDWSVFFPMKTK